MTITATLLAPPAASAPGNAVSAERTAESGTPDFAAFLLENVPGLGARALAAQAKVGPDAGKPNPVDESATEETNPESSRESAQLLAALPVFREMLPSASQPQPRAKGDETEGADAAGLAPSHGLAHRPEAAPALPVAATEATHRPIAEIPAIEAPPHFHAAESRAALAPSPHVATIAAPVAHAAWNEELAAKVTWLATSRVQAAELRVQPPELGPVHVQIRIEANEANVSLLAPHADTRDALEAALPDLRAALEARGIALGDASIGDSRGSGAGPHHPSAHSAAFQRAAGEDPDATAAPRAARSLQLVDVFA